MSDKQDILETTILDWQFRDSGATPAGVTSTEWSLYSVAPAENGGGGTELNDSTAPGYARATVLSNTGNWKNPSSATQGQVENLVKIVWPVARAAWPNVVAIVGWRQPANAMSYYKTGLSIDVPALGQLVIHENQLIVAEA